MPAALPLSDAEAHDLFQQYTDPNTSPRLRDYTETLLQPYFDAQDAAKTAADNQAKESMFERAYTDPSAFKEITETPEIQAAANLSPYPGTVAKRALNQAFLAHTQGLDPESLNDTAYAAFRDAYAQKNFGTSGPVTEDQFFASVAQQQQKVVETRKAVAEVPGDIVAARFEDMASGNTRSIPEILTSWRNRYPDLKPAEGDETRMMANAQQVSQSVDEVLQKYGQQTKAVSDGLQKLVAGNSDIFELKKLAETLIDIPTEDRQKIYQVAGVFAQRGKASEDGKLTQVAENAAKVLDRAIVAPIMGLAGAVEARAAEGDPKRTAQLQIMRELNEAANSKVDPIKQVYQGFAGDVENVGYNLAPTLPYLALAAIPVVGAPLTIAAYTGTEYDRISLAYPDLPIAQKEGMSIVSGAVQGALDKLQVETIAGRLPMTAKLFEGLAKPTPEFWAPAAKRIGLGLVEQNVQEFAQDLTPVIIDAAAHALREDMPEFDGAKDLELFARARVDTFFALLPLVLIGGGAGAIVNQKSLNTQFFASPEAMQKTGIPADLAQKIATETDPAKQRSMFRGGWKEVPAKSKIEFIAKTDAANEAAVETQQSQETPTMEVAKDAAGANLFVVRDSGGKEIYRTSDEDAANEAFADAHSHSALKSLLADEMPPLEAEQIQLHADDALGQLLTREGSADNVFNREPARSQPSSQIPAGEGDSGKDAEAAIKQLGVPLVRSGKTPRARAVYDSSGSISVELNPTYVSALSMGLAKKGADGSRAAGVLLGEELVHGAHLVALRDDWKSEGSQGSFVDFVRQSHAAIFADIRNTVEAATPEERGHLLDAIRASYHVYSTPLDAAARDVVDPATVLDEIGQKDPVAFVAEFLRQATELKRAGSISEETYATLWDRLAAWVSGAIEKIKTILPDAYKGRFGKLAADHLRKIESTLATTNPKGKSPSGDIASIGARATPIDLQAKLAQMETNPEIRREAVARARVKLREIRERSQFRPALSGRAQQAAIQLAKDQHTQDVSSLERQEAEAVAVAATPKEKHQAKFAFTSKRRALDSRLEKQIAEASGTINDNEAMLRSFGELKAIISILPMEARGRVGGFEKLASFKDRGRASYLSGRIDRVAEELEEWLRKDYRERIEKLLDRSKPKGKGGERPGGKLGPEAHAEIDQINKNISLDRDEVEAALDESQTQLLAADPSNLKAISSLVGNMERLRLFGNLYEKNAIELDAAFKYLTDLYKGGREKVVTLEEGRVQELAASREALAAETGKENSFENGQEERLRIKTIAQRLGTKIQGILSFEQTLQYVFGKNSPAVAKIVRRVRSATTLKRDLFLKRQKEFKDIQRKIFPDTKDFEIRKKLWAMSQIQKDAPVYYMKGRRTENKEITVEKAREVIAGTLDSKTFGFSPDQVPQLEAMLAENDARPGNRQKSKLVIPTVTNAGDKTHIPLSQAQAINLLLTHRQERYQEALAFHGWTKDAIGSVEKFLTPEAKKFADWMADKADREHSDLNQVFQRMFHMNLPKEPNYWPGSFEHDGETREMDPYAQGLMPEGGISAGFSFTRKEHKAKVRLEDAFQVYHSHSSQIEHWKAFAETVRDLRATFGNSDLKGAITAKAGSEYAEAIEGWISAFENNGLKQRRFIRGLDKLFQRFQASQAINALSYNISSYAKQGMAAIGAAADMPSREVIKRYVTGDWTKHYHRVFNDPVIQQRMQSGFSPEVRQAMESYRAEPPSRLLDLAENGLEIMGQLDARFTAVSASAAYGYHYDEAKSAGLTDEQADAAAMQKAEETVARTAQPAEIMDRSLYELGMSPSARFAFMFLSPVRQQAAMEAMAIREVATTPKGSDARKRAVKDLGRILFIMHVLLPVIGQTIYNAWRDAKDGGDDDEIFDPENWNWKDYATVIALGPASGLPIVGDILELSSSVALGKSSFKGGIDSDIAGGVKELKEIVFGDNKGNRPWDDSNEPWSHSIKSLRKIATAISMAFGGKAAAFGLGAKLGEQAVGVGENAKKATEE